MYQAKHRAEETIKQSGGIEYTIFKPSGMFKDFYAFHIPMVLKREPERHLLEKAFGEELTEKLGKAMV